MKKLLSVVLGVLLLVATGYAASAFFIGKQVESALADPYKQLAYNPNVKVVKRDYQRGIFASTETVVIELFGDLFRAMGQQPPTLSAYSVIKHGPAPGMSMMAAAVVDSEILLGAGGKPAQKMMTAHTVIRHDGSGDMTTAGIASAFDFIDPMGLTRRISWEGFNGAMQFTEAMKEYSMQVQMPRFELSGEDGMRFTVAGIRLDSKAKQVFDNEPALHATTQKLTVDEMNAKARFGAGAPVVLRNLSFDSSTPVRGEFLDGVLKSTIAEVRVDQQNYGPAHFDMAVRNMHGRTLVKFQKALGDMNKSGNAQADPMAAMQPLLDVATELLAHNPELVIERLSFTTPQGEVLIKSSVKLPGVTREDASNVMVLAQKVDATMDIAVPEAMLMTQFGPQPVSQEAGNQQMQVRQQQIARLVEQGYMVREGTTMKTRLAYQAGAFTVNGLPFDVAGMMRPPQPMEQPMPIPSARPPAPMPVAR